MNDNQMYFDVQYFVRRVLREKRARYDVDALVNEWCSQHQAPKKVEPSIWMYKAYHLINELLPSWAEREGVKGISPIDVRTRANASQRRTIHNELKHRRQTLLLPLDQWKEDEVVALYEWCWNERPLPDRLAGLVVEQKDLVHFLQREGVEKTFNGLNTCFLFAFVLVVMMLNL